MFIFLRTSKAVLLLERSILHLSNGTTFMNIGLFLKHHRHFEHWLPKKYDFRQSENGDLSPNIHEIHTRKLNTYT